MKRVFYQVIDETLRVITFSLTAFREAKSDVQIDGQYTLQLIWNTVNHLKTSIILISHVLFSGYIIPKGWKVLTWFRNVHLDPEIYPDPKNFDPSRWEVFRDNRLIAFYNETVFVTVFGAAVSLYVKST